MAVRVRDDFSLREVHTEEFLLKNIEQEIINNQERKLKKNMKI